MAPSRSVVKQREHVVSAVADRLGRDERVVAVLPFALTPKRPKPPRKVRDGIQAKLSALEADGCDVILLLCTGQFHGLRCERAWLLEPDRIIPPAIAGLIQDRQLGVIVPLPSQMKTESGKWTLLPRMPIFAAASPYDDPLETLGSAGLSLKQRGAQALLLDCIGFTEDHRRALANEAGLPVILSNAVMARLVAELLAA